MNKVIICVLATGVLILGFFLWSVHNQEVNMSTQKFYPVIVTKNLEETVSFYETLLKSNRVFESNWYVQLVNEQGIEIGVMLENQTNQPQYLHKSYAGDGIALTIETSDVSSFYEDVKQTSIEIVYELKDEEWGQRHFMVRDPNGLVVDFVQHL